MIQECLYNPKKDISEVDQFGFVDTVRAEAEGFVRPDLSPSVEEFDGVEVDPESIIGKPRDAFDAMRMQERLANGIKSNIEGAEPKTNE